MPSTEASGACGLGRALPLSTGITGMLPMWRAPPWLPVTHHPPQRCSSGLPWMVVKPLT